MTVVETVGGPIGSSLGMEQVSPNWHDHHISDDVLPVLRERSVTDEQIDTMLVDNPWRYFGNAGAH